MTSSLTPLLAEVGRPLFDNQWLALFVILGSITAFILAIAALGRWLAATHPDEPLPVKPILVETSSTPPPEIFAAIAAAVAVTLGKKARVTAVNMVAPHASPETARQWALEGRRNIYSSHKIR